MRAALVLDHSLNHPCVIAFSAGVMCDVRTRRCRRAAIGRTEQGAVAPIHDDASTAAVEAPAVDRDGSVCPGIEGHGGHDELGRKSPSLVPGPAAVKGLCRLELTCRCSRRSLRQQPQQLQQQLLPRQRQRLSEPAALASVGIWHIRCFTIDPLRRIGSSSGMLREGCEWGGSCPTYLIMSVASV